MCSRLSRASWSKLPGLNCMRPLQIWCPWVGADSRKLALYRRVHPLKKTTYTCPQCTRSKYGYRPDPYIPPGVRIARAGYSPEGCLWAVKYKFRFYLCFAMPIALLAFGIEHTHLAVWLDHRMAYSVHIQWTSTRMPANQSLLMPRRRMAWHLQNRWTWRQRPLQPLKLTLWWPRP